ncbi:MAG: T9SS type A sorting domain-containing protein [Ignavibacteriales bacterium]|nr:T9SS type A sorting domain-containing protein [Ignavibacteriales bacterium]
MHAAAVKNYGYNFDSSTNEAIMYELINLNDYKIADYILGVESTINETFSSTEQSKVSSFLNNGGALFVSGAEIAWDLDYMGSTTDKNFFYNYLKAEYINDAPNGQSKTYYTAEGIAGNIFDGITNITYDNGTHGTYNVEWPDVINGKNGGSNALKYTGVTTNNGAGVVHKGFFPNGTTNGAVVYFGFPFETIYPESKRFEVMNKVLEYFEILNDISNEFNKFPNEYKLYQNYPNPFNPSTNIKYSLPEAGNVKLSIYNVLGQEVETLVNEYKEAGNHSVSWGANNFSSGVYIYKLEVNSKVMLNKMILLK